MFYSFNNRYTLCFKWRLQYIKHITCRLFNCILVFVWFFFCFVFCFVFVFLFWFKTVVYGSFHSLCHVGATTTGPHHSHSHIGSLTHSAGPGIKSVSSWILVRFISSFLCATTGIPYCLPVF